MGSRLRCWALFLILFLASSVMAAEKTVRKGKHFELICHFESDQIADQALETAEAVWPAAIKLFGFGDKPPGKLLEIHLMATPADFVKVEGELTNGKYRQSLSFTHAQTDAAYIAVQPACSLETLRLLGLPAMTRRMIAQEAVNLIRYAAGPNPSSSPDWLTEGTAAGIGEAVMTTHQWSAGEEADPRTSAEILRVTELADRDQLPSVDRILSDDIYEVQPFTRAALRRMFLAFLQGAMDEPTFRAMVTKPAEISGHSNHAWEVKSFVAESLGAEKMKALDGKFKAFIRGKKPQWDEVFSSLSTVGKEWTQHASPDSNAIAWHREPVGKDEYVIEGEVKIAADQQQLNLLLGESGEGFISVAFVAGFDLFVFQHHTKDNSWEPLDRVKLKGLKANTWCPFRVEIANDQLSVTFGESLVLTESLRGRSMGGRWGLGAQAGSAGVWRGLVLK